MNTIRRYGCLPKNISHSKYGDYVTFEDYCDKIDGLESDLSAAVEMLFRHGNTTALEWLHLNYPMEYARLHLLRSDRVVIPISADGMQKFVDALDNPPEPNDKLKRMMRK